MPPLIFSWTINLGEVITLLTMVAGFCFTVGRLVQRVEHIAEEQDEDRQRFQNHERQDNDRFDTLTLLLSKKGSSEQ